MGHTSFYEALASSGQAWALRPVLCLQDEPTSHLDMLSIGSLMACLQAYSGAIVLVSHDQHFVAGVASQVGALYLSRCLVTNLLPPCCSMPTAS